MGRVGSGCRFCSRAILRRPRRESSRSPTRSSITCRATRFRTENGSSSRSASCFCTSRSRRLRIRRCIRSCLPPRLRSAPGRWRSHEFVGCLIGLGTVVGVTLLTRNLAGKRAGLLAGLLAAIYPPLWLNDGGVMSEGLYALAIVLVLLASYRFVRGRPPSMRRSSAATVGLAALVRAGGDPPRRGVARSLDRDSLLAAASPDARRRGIRELRARARPVGDRNMVVFSRPVTISTGDATVAGANCPQAYRGSTIGLWFLSCYDHPPPGDESVASAFWRRQGERYAAASHEPASSRRDRARRADMGRVQSGPDDRRSGDDGRAQWTGYVAMIGFWLLAPVGLGGLVVLHRRKVPVLPLVAQLVLVTVAAVLVWGAVVFVSRPTSCSSSAPG